MSLEQEKYRANFALQTGTYVNDNLAAEPGVLKNIFEANVGLSLNKKNNLWLDVGILPSHIGFESAISTENLTLTPSLLAENSPYFLTGGKLTYSPSDQLELAALVVNGWQRIQRLPGNSLLSFGTQVNYKPTDKLTFNWSTFIGTDDVDVSRRMRYFSNQFARFKLANKFELIAGFDIGRQQVSMGSADYSVWFSPVIINQLTLNEKWKIAIRLEYYQDDDEVIVPTQRFNDFRVTSLSTNVDYTPYKNVVCRLEARLMNSEDLLFVADRTNVSTNFFVGASVAVKFKERILK